MLKICYNTCCGIDVHKKMLVATIATTNERKVTTYQTKQFSTFTNDIKKLKQWLFDNNCKDVCMESTGKYWIPILLPYQKQINLILTVPGIKDVSAITILSEIGPNMSLFKDSEHLCSWAGLTPQCNESAGKKKSVHISRAGVYIKPLLVQCANNAIRDKSCPYFKLRYDAIKKRRGHKRAIIAIARMLLTCIYQMLSKNEPFNHEIYEQLTQKNFKSKDKKLNINNAIKFLESQGYKVS